MILYQPVIVPSRMTAVLRLLAQGGPATLQQLQDLMQPEAVRKGEPPNKMIDHNLKACVQLGLVSEQGDRYAVADGVVTGVPDYAECLRLFARRLVGRDMPQVDRASPHEYYQFARVTAWFLDQPAGKLPLRLADVQDVWPSIAEEGFRDVNNPAWPQWLHWAQALGLATDLDLTRVKADPSRGEKEEPARTLVVNPTGFLQRHLDELLPKGLAKPASAWLPDLGERFPVFETGWIRRRVRDDPARILSDSLSLALLRLEDLGQVELTDRKDAERYLLHLGRFERTFTHLARQGGQAR
jgi:hypothetical protein